MASVLLANIPILLVMLLLLCCSAFFSAAETSLFSLTQEDLRAMAAKPSRSGRRITLLLSDAHTLLASVLFGNMLVNLTIFGLGVLVAWEIAEVSHAQAAVRQVQRIEAQFHYLHCRSLYRALGLAVSPLPCCKPLPGQKVSPQSDGKPCRQFPCCKHPRP